MDWITWCNTYPARVILDMPKDQIPDGPFYTQECAESVKDKIEIDSEIGGLEVVCYQERFYILLT